MASRRDVETAPATPDERAPLLAPSLPPTEEPVQDADVDAAVAEQRVEAAKRREYGWRGFWIVVGIVGVGFFVKGWVEADDVDVSIVCLERESGKWGLFFSQPVWWLTRCLAV